MKNEFVGMLLNGAKTLVGKKSTQDILKYIANVTLNYASSKFNVVQYKYDPMDMKNMIYHYNLNNGEAINKNDVDKLINMLTINRFMQELSTKDIDSEDPMLSFVKKFSNIVNDAKLIETYDTMFGNNIIQQFDIDTIETSGIADSQEIKAGKILMPDRHVMTSTIEGCDLANKKNEYLEKRIQLGEDANSKDVKELIQEYQNKINYEEVLKYFN